MRPFDRMIHVLEELSWKDADLYSCIGVSKQRFNGWKQRSSIPKDMLEPVAKALNISSEWLLTGNKAEGVELTAEELAMLKSFKELPPIKRRALKQVADLMLN